MKKIMNPTQIIYDTSAVDYIASLKPKNVCITTDPIMLKLGILDPIRDYLKAQKIAYEIFSDVQPDPSEALVQKGLMHIIETKPDLIIALGGGSAIDLAKAIVFYCIKIKEKLMQSEYIHKPLFVAIPTTSGTGSEVTNYAVITSSDGKKQVIQSELIQPDVAILDASLTLSAPDNLTAETGFDALTHALEAIVSLESNPFSEAYALKAIELIFENLIPAYQTCTHLESKKNMQLASTMAGMAFNQSGLGLCHSIAHSIGATCHLSHGLSNALVLPEVMKFNSRNHQVRDQYNMVSQYLGLVLDSPDMNVKALIESIRIIKQRLNLPTHLHELNIPMDVILSNMPKIITEVKQDFCSESNPINFTDEDIRGIIMTIC
ncbi:iron-containing alcohol dehydrogenase [Fusibacter ferrireducens]|uniref:Iron-containing alcohol dehydrogenase n=1 Tax=Fusibacter ferrireducens TaxID=2785058 RepID=A0ABR9ZZQ3_9FIRM|nr:iron-containing alcohol dehydrogenase [Fusibacter ferrireducens]MBF4695938.1 iron-containing alcohol dehydrogenase [Fusibacter ferrireducens]